MSQPLTKMRVLESTVIAIIFVLLLLVSPVVDWWAGLRAAWYAPYLIWLIVILVTFLLQRYLKKNAL